MLEKTMPCSRLTPLLGLALLALLSACGKPRPGDADFVLAEGKGFQITNADLEKTVQEQVSRIKKSGREPSEKEIEEIRKRNLPFVIDRKLIELEISRIKPVDLDKLVATQFERTRQLPDSSGSRSRIPENTDAIRRKVSWELVLLDHSKQVSVPDKNEAQRLYQQNPDHWRVPGMVQGIQFLLPVAPNSPESTWKTAKASLAEVRKKLRDNVPVSAIQRERLSQKMPPLLITSTSWLRQDLPKELGSKFDQIRADEVTEILKSPRGLIFYHFERVTPEKKLSFEEALPRIQEQMKRSKLAAIRRNLLKDLRQSYQVRICIPGVSPAS